MPITTLEIAGSPVDMAAANLFPARMNLRLRGASTLTLVRRGGALVAPDPWLGKPIVLKIDGEPVFVGDVDTVDPRHGETAWAATYQCRDLKSRMDRVPFVDAYSRRMSGRWNHDAEDETKIDSRLGRTVGQILAEILTMQDNADRLDAKGLGNYASLSPPELPADTLADLAAMTVIPPHPVQFSGEHLATAIQAFLQVWAPNHAFWIEADGTFRFHDQRAVEEIVLTMDDCDLRMEPSGLSRSLSECYQRVVVWGEPVAAPQMLTLSGGTLQEDFAWGSLTNSQAKDAWTLDDFERDQDARSEGTCSVLDLTHVTVTSNPTGQTWATNEWDQGNRRGMLYCWYESGSGINQVASARVVANTSKSSGGTSTFTLETPLPATNYNRYVLRGLSSGASYVWRRYKVVDATVAAALANRFTYPVPFIGVNGNAASLTSYPTATVCWSSTGSPPYNEFPDPIADINRSDGTFLLYAPTWRYNQAPPSDVRILAAVNTGVLSATKPASGYAGTSHTVDGMEETLYIMLDGWRDPANQLNVESYAQDVLDSVKDAMIDGSIVIHKLFPDAFNFGVGVSIDAAYATGWEDLNAPVVEVEVAWNSRSGSHHTTTLTVSNRRASYDVDAFLTPERRAADGSMGFVDSPNVMGGPRPQLSAFPGDGADGEIVTTPRPSRFDGPDASGGFDGGMDDSGGFSPDFSSVDWSTGRDMRSAKDSTPARDTTSWKDPTPARDSTPSGGRGYKAREADKAAMRKQARTDAAAAKDKRIADSQAKRDAIWKIQQKNREAERRRDQSPIDGTQLGDWRDEDGGLT